MTEARDRVLANVRRSLARQGPLPPSVTRALETRLAESSANVVPAVPADTVDYFERKVEAVNGRVTRVQGLDRIPAVVTEHLETHGLPFELVVAPDPALDGIAWSNRLAVERRAAVDADRVSVTGAYAGVAETGSVVLLSGPESPTTLNFLPDDHLVVLSRRRIVSNIEDVWARFRAELGGMPRTVNFITGPSKTGDVEQTIYEGAHGPRRFHVIVVED